MPRPSTPGFPSGTTNPLSSQPTQSSNPGTVIPSTIPSNILGQLNQSTNLNLHPTTSTSASDLINALANPNSASGSTTNTPSNIIAMLNPDIAHIATITNGNSNQNTQSNNSVNSPSSSTITITSLVPSQTFTSGNNTPTASSSYTLTDDTSPLQTLLASLQSVLINILGYLQGLVH